MVNNKIQQNQNHLDTNMQEVAVLATLYKTIAICFIYMRPNCNIVQSELDHLVEQFRKAFILLEDFKCQNEIWGSRETNRKCQIIENIMNKNNLCLYNKSNTYLHPATRFIFRNRFDPGWITRGKRMTTCAWWHCGSEHFPLIFLSTGHRLDEKIPRWKLRKDNWLQFQGQCKLELIPDANINNEDHLTHFTKTPTTIAEAYIPKSSDRTKCFKHCFDKECLKAFWTCRTNHRKRNLNPRKWRLSTLVKARRFIKEDKRTTWKNYISKINSNTKSESMRHDEKDSWIE